MDEDVDCDVRDEAEPRIGDFYLAPIPSDRLESVPEHVWENLERSLVDAKGSLLLTDLIRMIAAGRVLLLGLFRGRRAFAFMAIEKVTYPRTMRLRIIALSGLAPVDEWLFAYRDHLIDFARNIGASGIEAVMRPGLARKLGHASAPRWVLQEVG